jgi:hypothetical protein
MRKQLQGTPACLSSSLSWLLAADLSSTSVERRDWWTRLEVDSGRTGLSSRRRFSIPSSAPCGPLVLELLLRTLLLKLDQTKSTLGDTKGNRMRWPVSSGLGGSVPLKLKCVWAHTSRANTSPTVSLSAVFGAEVYDASGCCLSARCCWTDSMGVGRRTPLVLGNVIRRSRWK